MVGIIYKYEPFWQEVSVKSFILRWPLRPVGFLFLLLKYILFLVSIILTNGDPIFYEIKVGY